MLFHEVLQGVFLKLCTQGSRAIGIGQQACTPVLCPIHFVSFNHQVLVVVCIFRLLWPGCSETGGGVLQLQNSAAAVRQEGESCSCRILQLQWDGKGGLQLQNSAAAVRQERESAAAELCSCSETRRGGCSCRLLQPQRGERRGLQLQNSAATVRREGEGCSCRILQVQ